MDPERRAEIESQLERALRRGELALAREALSALVAAFPDDQPLRLRLADLEDSALPGELSAPRRPPPSPPPEPALGASQHVAEGERLFHGGDFPGAVAAYRRALHERPDSELLQERLVELYQLSQAAHPGSARGAAGPSTSGGTHSPPAPPHAHLEPQAPSAPAPGLPAPVGPGPSRVDPGPGDRAARLEALLGRIAERRRGG